MDRGVFLSQTQAWLEQGAYESALDAAMRRLEENPGDVDALIVRCHACMRLGRLDDAAAVIDEVEEAILGLSRIHACMGDICFKGGLNREAAKFYRRFLALNPGAELSRDISGKLRILEEDQPELVPDAEGPQTLEPPVTAGFQTMTMVDLYFRQGHLDAAEALLVQMLTRDPDSSAIQEKLEAVRSAMRAEEVKATSRKQREKVMETLNRWLDHLQRRRRYAI